MKKMLKKFIHKFIIDEKGAVSIFLIMILILLFLFNAVLIDFARIMIADRQTEEAAKVSIRSTMSSYHQNLQDAGLFAFDGDQGEAAAIFNEVFENNISASAGGNFDLLALQAEESEINVNLDSDRSLANKDILRYQILEEMKYKAPVEVGEAILKNFLSLSEKVEEASNYSKVAKEVNELSEEMIEKLEEAQEKIESAKSSLEGVVDSVPDTTSEGSYPEISTTYDIFYYHDRYYRELEDIEEADEAEDDEDIDEEDIDEKRDDTRIFKERAINILESIVDAAEPAYTDLGDAIDLVLEAQEINNEIEETVNDPDNTTGDDYDNANDLAESGIEGSVDNGTLEDFIMDDSFFTTLNELLDEGRKALDTESGPATNALIPKVEQDFLPVVRNDFEDRNHSGVQRHHEHTVEYYWDADGKTSESLQHLIDGLEDYRSVDDMSRDEVEDEIENEEEEADEGMEDAKDELDEIADQIGESAEDSELLAELNRKASEYGVANSANQQEFTMEDRDDTTDQAMSFIDIIFKGIGDMLVNARDEVYVNEYILMRFKSHDFSNSGADAYSFKNNQVEYMIYGLPGYGSNHLAAMSEIFAVRFAINFTAALMSPETKLFGPLFWAASLKKAFWDTAADMRRIASGEPVQLFPRVRALGSMDYKDHLRLFLFIHPEGGKFHRLMAVLDNETGANLDETPTYVTAEATTSIDLWFIPQVADLLGSAGLVDGRVEDGRYYIEKEVNFSY